VNEQNIKASSPANLSDQSGPPVWRQCRYGFAAFFVVSLMALWFALRLVLFLQFKPEHPLLGDVLQAFLIGTYRDLFVGLLYSLPLFGWFLILTNRAFGRLWHRLFVPGGVLPFLAGANLPA